MIERGYFTTDLSYADFEAVMKGRGWMTSMQIGALLAPQLAPEVAVRYYLSDGKPTFKTFRPSTFDLATQVAKGRALVVRHTMWNMMRDGRVERMPIGTSPQRYRWLDKKGPAKKYPKRHQADE